MPPAVWPSAASYRPVLCSGMGRYLSRAANSATSLKGSALHTATLLARTSAGNRRHQHNMYNQRGHVLQEDRQLYDLGSRVWTASHRRHEHLAQTPHRNPACRRLGLECRRARRPGCGRRSGPSQQPTKEEEALLPVFASVAKFRFTRALSSVDFQKNEEILVPLLKTLAGYRGYSRLRPGSASRSPSPSGPVNRAPKKRRETNPARGRSQLITVYNGLRYQTSRLSGRVANECRGRGTTSGDGKHAP